MKPRTPPAPAAPAAVPVIPPDLAALSTDDLRAELARRLALTAENLVRLALVVRALEERGEDLSDLRLGLLGHLRRIAYGQVLPELVVRFASSPLLLRHAESLPLPDQRRLADGEPVPLVTVVDGRPQTRLVDPRVLGRGQVRQILGPEGLRGEAEQLVLIEATARPAEPTAPPRRAGKVRADRKRNGLLVGKTFVPAAQVVEALAQIRVFDHDADADLTETVAVKLTEEEHAALRTAAARVDLSMAALARRCLAAHGLLSPS